MFGAASSLLTLVLALAPPATVPDGPPQDAPTVAPRLAERPGSAAAVGAALVPGVLLHGSGHFVLGDREGAQRLLLTEGLSLGSFVAGMAVLVACGGSEKAAPLYVVPAVGGATLFVVSWLADVVGAARGTAPFAEPWRPEGTLYLGAGYVGLFASRFDFRHDLGLSGSWYAERWRAGLSAVLDPAGRRYGEAAGRVGYLLWRPGQASADELFAVASLGYRRFASDRFTVAAGEVYADGRFDLGRVARSMRHAWVRARLGAGLEQYRLDAAGAIDRLPLLVFGLGMGLQASARVGLELDYWQKKNELPGGLVIPGGFDGFFGMLELQGRVKLDERWALRGGVRYGAGLMPWLSVEAKAW